MASWTVMSVTVKRGKVVIRFGDHQCSLNAENATKLGLKLLDAAQKAAGNAGGTGDC